jgi:hypothetical protein
MQLIDSGILLEREDETLPFRDVKDTDTFHREFWH